jgi:hypothetical protein
VTHPDAEPADAEFAKLLAWAYRGELSGEAMFSALVDAWENEKHRESLRVLAELEHLMALTLAPLLTRHTLDGGDDERSRRTGRDNAALIAEQGWDDFLAQFVPATDAAIVRYHRLRAIAPDRDPAFDELIAHEEALQAFGVAEMRGDSGNSLDPVRAVIARLSVAGRSTGQ